MKNGLSINFQERYINFSFEKKRWLALSTNRFLSAEVQLVVGHTNFFLKLKILKTAIFQLTEKFKKLKKKMQMNIIVGVIETKSIKRLKTLLIRKSI